jgi:hypothetical protein
MRHFLPLLFLACNFSHVVAVSPVSLDELEKSDTSLHKAIEALEPARLSKPYRRQSLESLTNEQVLAWTGPGKRLYDLEHELLPYFSLPPRFWIGDLRESVRDLVESNRSARARKEHPLKLGDAVRTPEAGVLSYSGHSAHCYNAVSAGWCLRWHPEKSWLAFVESWTPGVVDHPVFASRQIYNLRFIELPPAEARRIADAIVTLRGCSTKKTETTRLSILSSTADGFGTLSFRADNGRHAFEVSKTVWAHTIREYCSQEWNDEVFLNFSARLLTHSLPEHLGAPWEQFAFRKDWDGHNMARGRQPENPKQIASVRKIAGELLGRQIAEPGRIAPSIIATAVSAVGDYGFVEFADMLAAVEKAMPAPSARQKRLQAIEQEIVRYVRELGDEAGYRGYSRRQFAKYDTELKRALPGIPDDGKRTAKPALPDSKFAKVDALHEEHSKVILARTAHESGLESLRESLLLARKQLQVRDDTATLKQWAMTKSDGMLWAYRRLRELDKTGARSVIEALIERDHAEPAAAQALYLELADLDPDRAQALVASLSEKHRASLPATLLMRPDLAPMDDKSLRALIQIAGDATKGFEERVAAIESLVPANDPRRHTAPEIDASLLRLMETNFKDDTIQATLRTAAVALARRSATKHWDALEKAVASLDMFGHAELLTSMAIAAAQEPAKFGPRLRKWVEPHLEKTNHSVEMLLWIIWIADLRDLRPKLEVIATSAPDDYGAGNSFGGKVRPVRHRHHLARLILSFWDEEDTLRLTKLLAGFGIAQPHYADGQRYPGIRWRLDAELKTSIAKLDPAKRDQVREFLAWAEKRDEPSPSTNHTSWTAHVRELLGK